MNTIRILRNSLIIGLTIIGFNAQSKVVLPSVFSDNMVLQQKTNAAVWGKADAGKTITISTSWSNKHYTTTADANGKWKVMVATPAYGGPYDITINDGDALTLKNVLIGEVWVCSGQSNMEFPVSGWSQVINYKQELADAQYPNIRLLQVEHVDSTVPLDDAKISGGGWQQCNPQTVAGFSAVAYFFARDIYKNTGIPIGLIHTSWGGTILEAWTSEQTVKKLPDFAERLNNVKTLNKEQSKAVYDQEMAAWQKEYLIKDAGYKQGMPQWAAPIVDTTGWGTMLLPTEWETAGLPDFDGIVWYRKKVNIPQEWAGKDLQVSLGTIDDNDITFFNGEKIGETNGFNVLRNYTIPANKVKAGEFVLCIRILDGAGGGGLNSDKSKLYLQTTSGARMAINGSWDYKVGLDFKDYPMPQLNDGPNRPTVLFNTMINPFIQYAVKGAIWYQGESNAARAHQYRELFPAMIKDWRQQWNNSKMPFYFVQLANYFQVSYQPVASAWAELRDAQSGALALPNTGMAVAIDIGDGADIHPKNKQEVGHRLALIALAKNYGENIPYSGPVYSSYKINGNSISIQFKCVDGGLVAKNAKLPAGFFIAGADQKFYWADAVISGDKVIVSSPRVTKPVAVRYAWANNPVCNLYNGAGLPASPFRTDDWVDSTVARK
jgi:sialate O-acetylesterase